MAVQTLSNSVLLNYINHYTKKFIHFISTNQRNEEYLDCRKVLEALLDEWKKRKLKVLVSHLQF